MTGVYIAGPMRGYPAYNFAAFQQAQEHVEKHFPIGTKVFNPALNDIEHAQLEDLALTQGWEAAGKWLLDNPEEFSLREALHDDLAWIALNAEHIVLLPGWEKSAGVAAEKALGEALGIQFWYIHPVGGHLVSQDPLAFVEWPGPAVGTVIVTERHENGYSSATYASRDKMEAEVRARANETTHAIPLTPEAAEARSAMVKDEIRTTSATGGMKGVKPEQYQSIPPEAERELAEHYGFGAAKYEDHNFRKGYEWSKSYSALRRHLRAFWGGEDIDEETGSKHIIAVAWHALALATFMDEHPEFDDRYRRPEPDDDDDDQDSVTVYYEGCN